MPQCGPFGLNIFSACLDTCNAHKPLRTAVHTTHKLHMYQIRKTVFTSCWTKNLTFEIFKQETGPAEKSTKISLQELTKLCCNSSSIRTRALCRSISKATKKAFTRIIIAKCHFVVKNLSVENQITIWGKKLRWYRFFWDVEKVKNKNTGRGYC